MKQYIDRYKDINTDNKSYEMVIPTLTTEQEPVRGLNKTGVLLLKNIIDKMEYHLYDSSKPESVDINETLDIHTYNVIRKPIHISISCDNQILLNRTGILKKKLEHGIDKYYLVDDDFMDVDIEEILFDNTCKMTTIKINTIHNNNEEVIVDEEGNQADESTKCIS